MRQLSLQRIGDATGRTVQRFPLPLVSALVAAIAGVLLVDDTDSPLLRDLVLGAQLGIPLLLAAALAGERSSSWRLPRHAGAVFTGLAVVLLLVYGLSLPRVMHQADWLRFVHLNVGAHLLVVVIPYLRPHHREGLWAFGLELALRFLAATFFSAVLFAGLSVALLAVDQLLGVGIPDDSCSTPPTSSAAFPPTSTCPWIEPASRGWCASSPSSSWPRWWRSTW